MKKLHLLLFALLFANIGFAQKVTFSSDVANIIYTNCTSCHRTGSIAPFSLESYADVYANRIRILDDVQKKIMPPWSPDPHYSHFNDERKLTDDQINKITNWVNNGAERGNASAEPSLPVFSDASQLPSADLSKRCRQHTVNKTLDDFEFFAIPSGLTKDAFIKQLELVPANRKIVHHIFVFIDSTGSFAKFAANDSGGNFNGNNYLSGGRLDDIKLIGGWLPGGSYYTSPDTLGFRVPKNSFYIVQIHYAPGSMGQSDSTQLNIKYAAAPVRNMHMRALLDNVANMTDGPIYIPANKTATFHETKNVDVGFSIVSVTPHMHLIGKSLKVYAINPDKGDSIRIIDDRWNFHWQGMYSFPKPLHIPKGYTLVSEGYYDNTSDNSDNPNFPPKAIEAGTSTLTEMMQVFFCYITDNPNEDLKDSTRGRMPIEGINPDFQYNVNSGIYPNPARSGSEINVILTSGKEPAHIAICSIDGREIQSYNATKGITSTTIRVPLLPAGVYVLKQYNANTVSTSKFLIE